MKTIYRTFVQVLNSSVETIFAHVHNIIKVQSPWIWSTQYEIRLKAIWCHWKWISMSVASNDIAPLTRTFQPHNIYKCSMKRKECGFFLFFCLRFYWFRWPQNGFSFAFNINVDRRHSIMKPGKWLFLLR